MMSIGLFGFVIGTPGAALAANLPTGAQVVSGDVNINQLSNDAMRSNMAIRRIRLVPPI